MKVILNSLIGISLKSLVVNRDNLSIGVVASVKTATNEIEVLSLSHQGAPKFRCKRGDVILKLSEGFIGGDCQPHMIEFLVEEIVGENRCCPFCGGDVIVDESYFYVGHRTRCFLARSKMVHRVAYPIEDLKKWEIRFL